MAGKEQTQEAKNVRKPQPATVPAPQAAAPEAAETTPEAAVQRAAGPSGLRPGDVAALQRSGGNMAVQRVLASQVQRQDEKTDKASEPKLAGKKFDDFDGKQYRISGRAPNRKIEEVKRAEEPNGSGGTRVAYYAMGEVVDFKSKMPLVAYYPEPVSLGNWYPAVTHLNGMNVETQSGIQDAVALQETINTSLDESMNEKGVALQQSAVDVLYTYSAKRSNFLVDLFDCVKGKVGVEDTVTQSQETLMLDAVHNKQRVTVSAHSRGTIKTDNAVRTVYKVLTKEFLKDAKQDPEVRAAYEKALEKASSSEDSQLSPDMVADMASEEKAKQVAAKRAEAEMNAYIQLIYAGNAVSFPSKVLKSDLYVGKSDMVSFFVGTYTKTGADVFSNGKATMHKVSGGHGFKENYVKHVGGKIAEDLKAR